MDEIVKNPPLKNNRQAITELPFTYLWRNDNNIYLIFYVNKIYIMSLIFYHKLWSK